MLIDHFQAIRDVLLSRIALTFYGAALWGGSIASGSPDDSISIDAIMALLGSALLAGLPHSWVGVVVIPTGYAIGMLFEALVLSGGTDLTFSESLTIIFLAVLGSTISTLITQIRKQDHRSI